MLSTPVFLKTSLRIGFDNLLSSCLCCFCVASFDVPAIASLVVSICCDHFLLVDALESAEDFLGFVIFMTEIGCLHVLHVIMLLFDCASFLFIKFVCCYSSISVRGVCMSGSCFGLKSSLNIGDVAHSTNISFCRGRVVCVVD